MATVRDAFFSEIYNLVKKGEDIYIITADLGAPSLDAFREDFPNRYISVGIAEQNLVTVASGMALAGKKVIAYGLNPFPITRAFDQVRCLMAELEIPITLCALNAGICAAECGYTHMPIEDMAMLRTLSNLQIYNPTDESIAVRLADDTSSIKKPRIIRFDKELNKKIYDAKDINFEIGFSVQGTKEKAKLGIITNGCFINELYNYCSINGSFESLRIIDLYKLPVNKKALVEEIKMCEKILTIEENVRDGGLGSMILEIMSDYGVEKPIRRLGLDFSKGYYRVFTSRKYVRKDQGIDMDTIINLIKDYMGG